MCLISKPMPDKFAQKREIVLKHLKLGHISGEDGEVFKIDEKYWGVYPAVVELV